jgi:hypothetical protein
MAEVLQQNDGLSIDDLSGTDQCDRPLEVDFDDLDIFTLVGQPAASRHLIGWRI